MKNSVQEDRFRYMSEMFFINSTKERVRRQLKSLHYDLLLSCFFKKQVLPYVIKMRKLIPLLLDLTIFKRQDTCVLAKLSPEGKEEMSPYKLSRENSILSTSHGVQW